MAEGTGPKVSAVAAGAAVQQRYMVRTVTTYPVNETEMSTLSALNTEATIFFSIATLIIGLAASIWTNAVFYASYTDAGKLAVTYVAPVMLGIAAIFVLLGIYAICRRVTLWRKIKRESSPVQITVAAQEIVMRTEG